MAERKKVRRVAVFGGSGFLGREIVKQLAAAGFDVRVAVRRPERVEARAASAQGGEVASVYADVRDETSVAGAVEDCDAAVNAVGLYVEKGAETFAAVHELGALAVAHQCAQQELSRLVHISGIGADVNSRSRYVRSRGKGELMVRDVFGKASILRPSVMFGPQDNFINLFARIMRVCPAVPLFGDGTMRLQAVYVGDVARAVAAALRKPGTAGKTFELGGPEACTYRALLERVMTHTGRRRLLVPLPFFVWNMLADAASILPSPPITRDQVALMRDDNVAAKDAPSFAALGITPTALEDVLSEYDF